MEIGKFLKFHPLLECFEEVIKDMILFWSLDHPLVIGQGPE